MKIKGADLRLAHEYGQGFRLSMHITGDHAKVAREWVDDLKDAEISIEVKKWRNVRSLDANAYFHVLTGKIAEAIHAGNDETKERLVLEYGTQKYDENGDPLWFVVKQGTDPHTLSKYPKWFALVDVKGIPSDAYIEYKETHLMDSAEMHRLINGTISEAKELGIETLTPADLERMMVEWQRA